jgi:ectoine hydroxylase-related dioxygenase (phytanoyl-CoA dioxygenase family)
MEDWFSLIAAESGLPPDVARRLSEMGFVVVPGPAVEGGHARLSEAYDRAVSTADPDDVSVRSSTRVNDFVNRGPEFDGLYVYRPVLAACCRIIGRPFKLSTMLARTLEPGAPAQPLHADVEREADGWPLVGFILMVDDFSAENGATRFVPGSHLPSREPGSPPEDAADACGGQVLACGPAGSIIIFDGSVWHGHTANRSPRRRRSIQGAFIPREARSANDQAARIRPETLRRIGALAKYVLDVGPGHPTRGRYLPKL